MSNFAFELHRYAPELTKAFFKGVALDISIPYRYQRDPSKKSLVRAVRDTLFKPFSLSQRYVRVKKVYSEERHQWLNKTMNGHFEKTEDVLKVAGKLYEQGGGDLYDGTKMEQPRILVNFNKKTNEGAWLDITHLAKKYSN